MKNKIKIIIFCCCVTLLSGFSFVSYAGALKEGYYCKIVGECKRQRTNVNSVVAVGTNLTSDSRYMTVTVTSYKLNGKVFRTDSSAENTRAGREIKIFSFEIPSDCKVKVTNNIRMGSSSSTPDLETVSIFVN